MAITEQDALNLHAGKKPGKLEITPTKPMTTQRDLALAYSPGVAVPCQKIYENPDLAYQYTTKGNLVAVISNGTAVLGLGNLGGLASKPVMEGKAVLFKRFADIDSIDIELNTENIDAFIETVKNIGISFGGINLEDIKAPDCFIIEEKLKTLLDIPVFHDDQHGTAIITAAGFINGLDLTKRDIQTVKIVINGAGSAGIACTELLKELGVSENNIILCDTQGVIYKGRTQRMNAWKEMHSVETSCRSLKEALVGADAFIGLSVKGALTAEMVASMAENPLIFAMANPDPEMLPEDIKKIRQDAIIATGRSDYPNQVNNVLGFPYIFRGALDVRASQINNHMKLAAAHALAALARAGTPEEVGMAYSGPLLQYGTDYLIPVPFDPRLIVEIPAAVAQAAMDSGVAKKPIKNMSAYKRRLSGRMNPLFSSLEKIFDEVRTDPKTVIFTEGEEERMIRAAISYCNNGYGKAILIGYTDIVNQKIAHLRLEKPDNLCIHDASKDENRAHYVDILYSRLQRKGKLERDCWRYINHDRNIFAACMVRAGEADAMVTGISRHYQQALKALFCVLDPRPGHRVFGLSIISAKDRTIFIADTSVADKPSAEEMAKIAIQAAAKVRKLGHEPRLAFVSYSCFGNPPYHSHPHIKEAVNILDQKDVDFEYDGEMAVDTALDPKLMKLYSFCRLSGPANILIMPDLNSANIASKLLRQVGNCQVIGPILLVSTLMH